VSSEGSRSPQGLVESSARSLATGRSGSPAEACKGLRIKTFCGSQAQKVFFLRVGGVMPVQPRDQEEEGSHPMAGLFGILTVLSMAPLIQSASSRSRGFPADEAGARRFD
jgi:hypothetical protein